MLRIVVADDSSTIQKVIKIALETYDVDISEARSLIDLYSLDQFSNFNLLVISASLPGAETKQDFESLKHRLGAIPTVILLGSFEDIEQSDVENLGVVVRKPFESIDFIRSLESALQAKLPKRNLTMGEPVTSEDHAEAYRAKVTPPPPPAAASASSAPAPAQMPPETSEEAFDPSDIPIPPTNADRKGKRAFTSQSTVGSDGAAGVRQTDAENRNTGKVGATPKNAPQSGRGVPQTGTSNAATSSASRNVAGHEDLIRRTVLEYCHTHFPDLARKILREELQKLSEERNRYLVD